MPILALALLLSPVAQDCPQIVYGPSPGSGDGFGGLVAMDAERVLVGSTTSNIPATAEQIAFYRIEPTGLVIEDRFDVRPALLAIDGDLAAVQPIALDRLDVYERDRSSGAWSRTAQVFGIDRALTFGNDGFQTRGGLAIRNGQICYAATDTLYVLEPAGGSWQVRQTFQQYGAKIAIDGNRMAVGRSIYERSSATGWSLVQELGGITVPAFDNVRVDLEGDLLVVGQHSATAFTECSGQVDLHRRDPITGLWGGPEPLTLRDCSVVDPATAFGEQYGFHVELEQGRVIVSAPRGSLSNIAGGIVFVFEPGLAGGTPQLAHVLRRLFPGVQSRFTGIALAAADGRMVIGTPLARYAPGPRNGAVVMLDLDRLDDCDADRVFDACAIAQGLVSDTDADGVPDRCQVDQALLCNASPSPSSGWTLNLVALGSDVVSDDDLVIRCHGVGPPPAVTPTFGYLLTSQGSAVVMQPSGSSGVLCIGGAPIGRFVNQVVSVPSDGFVDTSIRTAALPTPTGPVAIAPGETWNFQLWHRDVVDPYGLQTMATSNFTNAISVTFR